MRNLSSLVVVLTLLFPTFGWCERAWIARDVDQADLTTIKLPDGREVSTAWVDDLHSGLLLRRGDSIIWSKSYKRNSRELWDFTFFVPVKRGGYYSYDINSDGYPEIAIVALEDGADNPMWHPVGVFTVMPDRLEFFARKQIRVDWGRYIYP